MVYSLQGSRCKVDHCPHSLGDSGGALCFYKVIKMSPLENLDVQGHNLAGSGEKFSFSSLVDG